MRVCKALPLFCTGALKCMGLNSHACHSAARDFPEMHVYSQSPSPLVKLGFHFWSGSHAFPRSGMRACKAHPLFRTGALECMGLHSHARHFGAPDFPEFRVYSQTSSALDNLGFHFGRVVMRLLYVAGVRARLIPCFARLP